MSLDIYNADCMPALEKMDDNQFDLAIVDPPYGIGDIIRHGKGGKQKAENHLFNDGKDMAWNKKIPHISYFRELQRISKNQIIWGGNYFSHLLDSSRCWLIWDKDNKGSSFADAEMAWTSFDKVVSIFKYTWNGMIQDDMKNKEVRIHPTQKPVALYKWLLKNYAKEGDTILDTHCGSCSIAIACHDYGFDLTAYELDTDYYNAAMARIKEHTDQFRMI